MLYGDHFGLDLHRVRCTRENRLKLIKIEMNRFSHAVAFIGDTSDQPERGPTIVTISRRIIKTK